MALKRPATIVPFDPARADMRLPELALRYRRQTGLLNLDDLRRINITVWLYRNENGMEDFIVNPNITIAELRRQFPASDETKDADDVGIHSEGRAAEFFRTRENLEVLQIFTERIPCFNCSSLLRNLKQNFLISYYYDKRTWGLKGAGAVLADVYELDVAAITATKLRNIRDILSNSLDRIKGDHQGQLTAIRNSWNPMGRVVQWANPASIPELSIWDDVATSLRDANRMLKARRFERASIYLAKARLQYMYAQAVYVKWKDGIDQAAVRAQWTIGVAAATIAAAVLTMGASEALTPELTAAARAAQTINTLDARVSLFIRIADSGAEIEEIVEQYDELLRAMP